MAKRSCTQAWIKHKGRQAASLRRMGADLGGGGSQKPQPDQTHKTRLKRKERAGKTDASRQAHAVRNPLLRH